MGCPDRLPKKPEPDVDIVTVLARGIRDAVEGANRFLKEAIAYEEVAYDGPPIPVAKATPGIPWTGFTRLKSSEVTPEVRAKALEVKAKGIGAGKRFPVGSSVRAMVCDKVYVFHIEWHPPYPPEARAKNPKLPGVWHAGVSTFVEAP